jgi:hypothetical protein
MVPLLKVTVPLLLKATSEMLKVLPAPTLTTSLPVLLNCAGFE